MTEIITVTFDDSWPEAVSDGLTLPCSRCTKIPQFDYRVTDDFWVNFVPEIWQRGVVCLPCLGETTPNKKLAESIIEVQWTRTGLTVILQPIRAILYE